MKPEEQAVQIENPSRDVAASEPVRKSLFSTHWETTEETQQIESYRQWSILAMISLILGIVSLIAFLYFPCLFLAVIGIPMALWAYVRIQRSEGLLIGSLAALLGLFLSILTFVGVSVMWPYYEYTVRTEADRFFHIWFDAVKAKDIRQVVEMRNPTWHRKLDIDMEDWWKSKLDHPGEMGREMIDGFLSTVNDQCMRTLWALGEQAEISYYQTTYNYYYNSKDTVTCLYAVTFTPPDQSGNRETFFIKISAERVRNPNDKTQLGWALAGFPTVVNELPEELKK